MSKRVLIVDDESLIASSLQVFLEDEGFVVVTAASGEEAVSILERDNEFAVCVMDMRLPGMDGNEAIRAIHACCPKIRFVVHTGSLDYNIPRDMEHLGIRPEHLFQKPVADMTTIAEAINSLLID